MSKVKSLFAAAMTLAVAASANAAVFTITPVITAGFTPDFSSSLPVNQTTVGTTTTVTTTVPEVFQVDYYFTISGLGGPSASTPGATETGFGTLAFDIDHPSTLSDAGGGWSPDTTTFLHKNGPTTQTIPIWGSNSDAGVSSTDLLDIVAYLANPPYTATQTNNQPDPRATLGQGTPAHIGTTYFLYTPSLPNTLSLGNVQYTTYDGTSNQFSNGNNVVDPNIVVFTSGAATPEPASLGLLAVGGAALLMRRKKA